ncbi:anaerobic C4-dicarboxylate transporter [Candidatus Profftia sp. (ex Adelges kitamiensis)]|uniref:anaerobic C4-dicarboxylate transporter n=1 Tax=Candidatus Profftia sp. (ex Adelges kitamiensis) TaxID=2864218 RepID=UPI001CE2A371|nr:anaerobic C4-dicarboxylate transporter [Candidatus Profftia sp. (ex Adelges kitamiensis)]
MLALELIIVLLTIFLGIKLGGVGIGFTGGLGVLALAMLGIKPGNIPLDIIIIIMVIMTTVSTIQIAGGMDYLIQKTEKILRKNPKYITVIAPIITYFLTIFTGTGSIILFTLPIITEVAKEQGIRPCLPLSTSVIASQLAITASPVSAAVVYMSSIIESQGISYINLLIVVIPSTFMAVLIMSIIVSLCLNSKLSDHPIYQKRLSEGLIKVVRKKPLVIKYQAKRSVWIFLLGIICIVCYAIINSPITNLIKEPIMNTTEAILSIMLSIAAITIILCHIETNKILNSSTLKSGMNACICILGVAWLGDTFIQANLEWIKDNISSIIQYHTSFLIIIFFFISILFYSQVATAKALMPMIITLNISPVDVISAFAAISGLFVIPTYPTLVAAVRIDDTGTSNIGKYIFNHTFLIPGTIGVTLSIIFHILLGSAIL